MTSPDNDTRSITLSGTESAAQHTESPLAPPDPDVVLRPKLDERFAFNRSQLLILICCCLFFMYYNYMRLFHSDFWGHVSYGTWILENRELPAEDMLAPHATGVPIMATAWGSQVLLGAVAQFGNDELFSHIHAALMLCIFLVYGLTFRMQSGSSRPAFITCVCVLIVWVSRHAVILLTALADPWRTRDASDTSMPPHRPRTISYGLLTFLLYALWANSHGSFFVGFAVLGCYAAGRLIEVIWKTGDIPSAFADTVVRQRLIMLWCAIAGSLVNPYGIDLHLYTLAFPANPNLVDIEEWFSLNMTYLEGPPMAFSWILICVVFRHSRRRIAPSDILLLLLFSTATCIRLRMVQWYAPALGFVLAPHIGDCYSRLIAHMESSQFSDVVAWMRVKSFRLNLIAAFLVWMTFCFSPISTLVLGGASRPIRQIYSHDTPRGVTEFFRTHPPEGQLMNPQWWGDWIVYDGPPEIQVFMTTNAVHASPSVVWKDYLSMARATQGHIHLYDKYNIDTIVVCKALQEGLRDALRQMPHWQTVYEDEISIVASRDPQFIKASASYESPLETSSEQTSPVRAGL